MGLIQSLIRILGCKNEEDEESERPIYPQTTLHHRNGDSERLPKIFIFHRLICRVLQKIRSVFQRLSPRKTADPILPIQNPAPTTDINDPSLLQNLLISSRSSNDSNTDDQELHPGNFHISVEIAQQNVDNFVEEEEKVMIKCINVDEGKWIKHYSSRHWIEEEVEQEEEMTKRNVVVHVEEEEEREEGGGGGKWIKHHSNRYWIEQEEEEEEDKWIEHYSSPRWIEEEEEEVRGKRIVVFHVEEEEEEEEQEDEDKWIEYYSSRHWIEEEEEEEVMTKSIGVVHVDEGKWIKHYSSHHQILLVGDGDFSFSACLALAFGCASNMIATSLDSEAFLMENYRNARANIEKLRSRSCTVMHEIDATKMANHAFLGGIKFDRIIYNFPFAGFFCKYLSRDSALRIHRKLVNLFLENAKEMISENGEIHISHKTNGFHKEWNLEWLASSHGLYLIEAVKFNHRDYPGYSTKCGFGGDQFFNCNPSKTYKFGHKSDVRY